MRTTFMVGTRNRKNCRYLLVGGARKPPFPGPWRLRAVIRNERSAPHPSGAASREAATRASRLRRADPLSTDSTANRTPSDRSRARPAT